MDFQIIDVILKTGQTNQYDYRFINNTKYYTTTITYPGGSGRPFQLSSNTETYKSI
jgi:hypothetical protein